MPSDFQFFFSCIGSRGFIWKRSLNSRKIVYDTQGRDWRPTDLFGLAPHNLGLLKTGKCGNSSPCVAS